MKYSAPLFIAFLFVAGALPAAARRSDSCVFPSAPIVLSSTATGLLQYWEFPDSDVLIRSKLPRSNAIRNYRREVETKINVDSRFLLQRYLGLNPAPDDAYNLGIAATSPVSRFRPISCLEALLLGVQIGRNPEMMSEPTEFLASYLRRGQRLRVYYLTNDSTGVSGLKELKARITDDLKNGWHYEGNLHNHSFFLKALDSNQPQGVLAPSATDMKLFVGLQESLGLGEASITNGFDTIHIPAEDFALYRSAQ
jgi:hypothetical protein